MPIIFYIASGIFICFFLVQLYFYFFYFLKLATLKKTPKNNNFNQSEPASVVIVAKNEYENLEKFLPVFFEQNYPTYEVIVVNNGSWDKSNKLLERFSETYPNLKVLTIAEDEKYPKGKKFALTLAIKAAKYDTLIFTDADCKPMHPNWIQEMMNAYAPKTELVLGYSPYFRKPGLLNYIIRYETFYTALQYFSFALARKAYMGVGRNLSYKKEAFFRVKGFASHNHIVAGDDDLFVNEVANRSNTEITIHPHSFIYSIPKKTWGDWFRQKKRHLNTGKYYKARNKWLLSLLNISHILFYASFAVLLCLQIYPIIILSVFGFRWITGWIINYQAMKKLHEKNLIWTWIFLDVFYPVYYMLIGLIVLLSRRKKNSWVLSY